jgi:transcription termination factor Rho
MNQDKNEKITESVEKKTILTPPEVKIDIKTTQPQKKDVESVKAGVSDFDEASQSKKIPQKKPVRKKPVESDESKKPDNSSKDAQRHTSSSGNKIEENKSDNNNKKIFIPPSIKDVKNRHHDKHHHKRKQNDRRKKEIKLPPIESMILTIDDDKKDTIVDIVQLQKMNISQLNKYSKQVGAEIDETRIKSKIVSETMRHLSNDENHISMGSGVIEILPDGYGFLRSPIYNYVSSEEDIYVSVTQIKQFKLRKGDHLVGSLRSPKEHDKYFALDKIYRINDMCPIKSQQKILFENLTPHYPSDWLRMETTSDSTSMRVLDLAAPIGKGQRAMIAAPPRTGKTIIMQQIANSIRHNNPECKLLVLLIDERPEEVTDMIAEVDGEVIASTFDEVPDRHIQVAEMVINRAKRLVESGQDVIILLDSLTRLARAYNTVQPHSGKILSGGVDANSLQKPKRFFGAARNIIDGGSLTIIATGMIETGSRMDEVIFEEFKGTGNMELVLDRRLSDRGIYPAIDMIKSGTRKEELLYHPSEHEKIVKFRRAIADLSPQDCMTYMLNTFKKFKTNVEFLIGLKG